MHIQRPRQVSIMRSLGLLVLFVVAAAATDIVKDEKIVVKDEKIMVKDEKIVYKCVLFNSDKGLVLNDIKFPLYTCDTEDGDKILIAGKDLVDEKLDAILDKETYLKLKDFSLLKRPKRQFGGFGGGGAGSFSNANAGSFGGGFGGSPGGFGGGPGFGAGFGGASASANAASFGGGGGSGFYG